MHVFKPDGTEKNSEHPESNQGPFDTRLFYSRTLYQLSYVRYQPETFTAPLCYSKIVPKEKVPRPGIEPGTSRSSV